MGKRSLQIDAVERHAPLQPALPEKHNLHVRQTRAVRQLRKAASRRRRPAKEDERSYRGKGPAKDPRKRAVVETLVREQRYVCYDQKAGRLTEEPVEADLVTQVLRKGKGLEN